MRYRLIHITTQREYKTPLVASQLFDQAQCQAEVKKGFAPLKVHAWIVEPMRERFTKEAKNKLAVLRKRCPDIDISMFNGVNRLNDFPVLLLLLLKRFFLNPSIPAIYHCRGESAAKWALLLRKYFPNDKVYLDVRGHSPAEFLYQKDIVDPAFAKGDDLAIYQKMHAHLKATVASSDGVTTVSDTLKNILIEEFDAPANTSVVPCCLTQSTNDSKRTEIRNKWGIKTSEILLVYSGTTAAYQHLDDLTFPFVRKLMEVNETLKLALLTPEPDKIKSMLHSTGVPMEKVIIENLPQKEVAAALTAADAGLLIRKPTLVNRVAHPVKIAEYLASGLPLIVEEGVGGISEVLYEKSVAKAIHLTRSNLDIKAEIKGVDSWLREDLEAKRSMARTIAEKSYLWKSAIEVHRTMYETLLKGES